MGADRRRDIEFELRDAKLNWTNILPTLTRHGQDAHYCAALVGVAQSLLEQRARTALAEFSYSNGEIDALSFLEKVESAAEHLGIENELDIELLDDAKYFRNRLVHEVIGITPTGAIQLIAAYQQADARLEAAMGLAAVAPKTPPHVASREWGSTGEQVDAGPMPGPRTAWAWILVPSVGGFSFAILTCLSPAITAAAVLFAVLLPGESDERPESRAPVASAPAPARSTPVVSLECKDPEPGRKMRIMRQTNPQDQVKAPIAPKSSVKAPQKRKKLNTEQRKKLCAALSKRVADALGCTESERASDTHSGIRPSPAHHPKDEFEKRAGMMSQEQRRRLCSGLPAQQAASIGCTPEDRRTGP